MKKLHRAMAALGGAFLVYLVWRVGARELWQEMRALGWGLAPLILSEGIANLAHAAGWKHCLGAEHRGVRLMSLFPVAMAGFAINYLTPSASVGGEVTKAAWLGSGHRGVPAVSSVFLDKLCTAVAHLIVVILGSAMVLWRMDLPPLMGSIMIGSTIALAIGVGIFMFVQKEGKIGALVRWLVARNVGGRTLRNAAHGLSAVDERLQTFHRDHKSELAISVCWHFLGHSMALVQTWCFFRVLGRDVVLSDVVCASVLCLWFDLLAFAIPLNLGALEGGRILALRQVGYPAVQGMAYGAALRIAQLFWAGYGLASYGAFIWSKRAGAHSGPGPGSTPTKKDPATAATSAGLTLLDE